MRTATIPIEHLAAEMCAAPLGTEVAFRTACTSLSTGWNGGLDAATARLWRVTERDMAAALPSISIDQVLGFRDHVWFGEPARDGLVLMRDFLRRMAGQYLVAEGPVARPRVPRWLEDHSLPAAAAGGSAEQRDAERRDDQARRSFRWLSFALPTDLLLAALDPTAGGPSRVDLLSPLLKRRLADRGFVETHLHYNAGLPGEVLWLALLRRLADASINADFLASPGAAFDEGRGLTPLLLCAAIARFVLGAHLARAEPLNLGDWNASCVGLPLAAAAADAIRAALWALARGESPHDAWSFADLQEVYAESTGIRCTRLGPSWSEALAGDALACYFPNPDPEMAPSELQFLRAGLRRIDSQDPRRDPDFERLFWQVIRAKCLFHRHIVQRPMTPGLTWFVRHYWRFGPAADALSSLTRMHGALLTSGRGRGLRAAELRRTPPRDLNDGAGLLGDLWRLREDVLPEPAPVEIGAVLHFARDRGGGARMGLPHAHGLGSHADPGGVSSTKDLPRHRFAEHYAAHRAAALATARLFQHYPASLFAIRGVDVCTDELGVPMWAVAPLVRHVKRAASAAAGMVERATGRPLQRFGTTVHAGEDFVHLLGGLRRVDEAIVHLELRRGDRLGHALALGTDPETWAERMGPMSLSCEERLFDLAWEWAVYARFGGSVPGDRVRYLGDAISGLAEKVFGRPAAPFEVCQFIELLHDEAALRWAGFPDGAPPFRRRSRDRVHRMLLSYLTDGETFVRGQSRVGVDPMSDRASLKFLHDRLRDEVASLGIVVEVNPSSNLLIGHLADLAQHPMWRLRPPRPLAGVRPVSVCIGSDDPIVFATSLPEEYQLVVDALTRAGLSDDDARGWAEDARRTGWDARFTVRPGDWPAAFDAICRADAVDMIPQPP